MTDKEKAEEILEEAYAVDTEEGRLLAEKALALYPNLVNAYIYLGDTSIKNNEAIDNYQKGMAAGEAEIGSVEFEEMKGHFWGFHQTRPYMLAKARYADCLVMMKKYEKGIIQFKELLELNPNDNQGLRFQYSGLLIRTNKYLDYEALRKQFEDEVSAFWLFNHAVYSFKKYGNSVKSNKALAEAHAANGHVLLYLIGEKEFPADLPDTYGWGSEEEAVLYLADHSSLFHGNQKMTKWLFKFISKNL